MRARVAMMSTLVFALLGCGSANTSNYVGAARAVAFGVGAAAAHRAATGNCWADCVAGTVCNRDTGLCERAPNEEETNAPVSVPSAAAEPAAPTVTPATSCDYLCRSDETCVLDPRGDFTCEPKAGVESSAEPARLP